MLIFVQKRELLSNWFRFLNPMICLIIYFNSVCLRSCKKFKGGIIFKRNSNRSKIITVCRLLYLLIITSSFLKPYPCIKSVYLLIEFILTWFNPCYLFTWKEKKKETVLGWDCFEFICLKFYWLQQSTV